MGKLLIFAMFGYWLLSIVRTILNPSIKHENYDRILCADGWTGDIRYQSLPQGSAKQSRHDQVVHSGRPPISYRWEPQQTQKTEGSA